MSQDGSWKKPKTKQSSTDTELKKRVSMERYHPCHKRKGWMNKTDLKTQKSSLYVHWINIFHGETTTVTLLLLSSITWWSCCCSGPLGQTDSSDLSTVLIWWTFKFNVTGSLKKQTKIKQGNHIMYHFYAQKTWFSAAKHNFLGSFFKHCLFMTS